MIKQIFSVCILFFIAACGSSSSKNKETSVNELNDDEIVATDASALTPAVSERDWLTKDALFSDEYPHASPIHNSYFLPVGDSNPEKHNFSGHIELNSRNMLGAYSEYFILGEESFKNFPDISLAFVSYQGKLIPLNRSRQLKEEDNSFWGIILDPGTVWSETGDDGWSRASFPFSFISSRRNQVHNGVASFLYNDNEISNLRIQVTQETAYWFKQDIYGQLKASYLKEDFSQATQLISAFQQEEAESVEIMPWSSLQNISEVANTEQFNSYLNTRNISSAGIIIDGIVYAQPCYTRYGDYPYCRWLRNGAYSVTKSLGASLTMMRLAQKYGVGIYELKIKDYVDVTAAHNGWEEVTFADVLNMVAGVGDNGRDPNSGDIFADENTSKMENWLVQPSLSGKLSISFSYQNYSWGPGEVFRYNSSMTIVLAAALDAYYKSIEGQEADLWQMMEIEVFNAIGIQHVPKLKTTETNDRNGIAELFHGLYLNVDDVAKLTSLLQDYGMYQQQQLLHPLKLQESLFETDNMGYLSWWEDNQFGRSRYLHGFWSSPYKEGNDCEKQIPYMSGYGGNIIAILPNNLSLYRFADANSYSPFNMIQASTSERAICN